MVAPLSAAQEAGAGGMVGHIEVEAEAEGREIRVDWRPLGRSSSETPPAFAIEGHGGAGRAAEFDGEARIVFAIGGSQADIARQLSTAAELGPGALEGGASIVLARLSPEFEVLAEVESRDAFLAALNTVVTALTPSADTARTLPDAFQYAVDSPGRKALFSGAAALPQDDEILVGIVSAAIARDIYMYPVLPAGDPGFLAPFAEVTGGRAVPLGEAELPGDLLGDFFGGQSIVFRLPVHRAYRLPGEAETPTILNVENGDATAQFELQRETPVLTWTQLAMKVVQPSHWTGWLTQPGRLTFGFGGLLSNAALVIGLFLLGRRFLGKPEQVTEPVSPQTVPDVTLAPLKKTIGRKEGCDFVLNDPSVSRLHAHLFQNGERMWVVDENSTNGLFILREGSWVQTENTPVEIGDQLKFGDCMVSVEELVAAVDLVPPAPGDVEPDNTALRRFKRPRRNPITGKIEEGAA